MKHWIARWLWGAMAGSLVGGVVLPLPGVSAVEKHVQEETTRARYTIDASYEPQERRVTGRMKVVIPRDKPEAAGEELYFRLYPNSNRDLIPYLPPGEQLGSMTVTTLRVNGVAVTGELTTPTVLRVPLPRAVKESSAQGVVVEMEYSLQLSTVRGDYGPVQQGETARLTHWYPVLAVREPAGWSLDSFESRPEPFYTRSADFRATFHLPRGYQVVSTAVDPEAPAEEVTLTQERVRDFAVLLTKEDYRVLRARSASGVQVNFWYPSAQGQTARFLQPTAVASLDFFGRQFGPYPYEELDLFLEKDPEGDGTSGMEYPALVTLNIPELSAATQPDLLRMSLLTTAHEVAHQWWYGVVGNNQATEPWLDEGLTSFSAALYMHAAEIERGAGQSLGSLLEFAAEIRGWFDATRRPPSELGMGPMEAPPQFSGSPYAGPVAMLTELSEKLGGVEPVLTILRTYYERYRHGLASAQDFTTLASEVTGRDLRAFFERWLRTEPVKPPTRRAPADPA